MKNSGIVFILSDFKAEGYEIALKQLSRKHDVVAVRIDDPAERTIPKVGNLTIEDPETGKMIEINPSSYSFQKSMTDSQNSFDAKTKQIFNQARVETLVVDTHEDHAERLLQFLKRRKQKR